MNDEKDRLGEKLRDKQRGDEDRYFAELDREKIEKLRQQRKASEKELGDCPRCGATLEESEHFGVLVDGCPSCGGVWLDNGELQLLQERVSEPWMTKWIRSVLGGKS
ncbi:MAG: hypothetical protein D6760_03880 [Deltaproteobacteria bacterium]|nr:MAG: hypothetical protein D6760_03880 [Deltaproteobacteria bacterium]